MRRCRLCWLFPLVLVQCACPPTQKGEVLTSNHQHSTMVLGFRAAWFGRRDWTLRIDDKGSVCGEGRALGRVEDRIPQPALAAIKRATQILIESVDSGTYTTGTDDADQLVMRVPRSGHALELRIDFVGGYKCSTGELAKIGAVWDLVISAVAPNARCNGRPCLLCEESQAGRKQEGEAAEPQSNQVPTTGISDFALRPIVTPATAGTPPPG
jgi:hypothetical protein